MIWLAILPNGTRDLGHSEGRKYLAIFLYTSQVLIRLVPTKDELAVSLKKDPLLSDQELIEHIKEALARAKTNIDEIDRFYSIRGQHSDQKSSSIQFRT